MSDMARIPLELGLRADANWFNYARRTTGINNRQTGPQHDKRNCKGTSSVSTRRGQQSTCRRRAFQGACVGARYGGNSVATRPTISPLPSTFTDVQHSTKIRGNAYKSRDVLSTTNPQTPVKPGVLSINIQHTPRLPVGACSLRRQSRVRRGPAASP